MDAGSSSGTLSGRSKRENGYAVRFASIFRR